MKPNGHRANKPFTARSLVGMTMGARKRAWLSNALYPVVFPSGIVTDETEMQAGYSWPEIRDDWPLLGERLRPCPGCCACWGHRISSAYGEIAECCGPQTSGKRKSQIKAMRKWQETLADDCDGSGVLPARKVQGPGMGTLIPGDWCPVWEPTKAKRPE